MANIRAQAMGSGTTTQDLADMFGIHRGFFCLGAPRKPEHGGDPSSQRFRPDARAHAAGASAVERPKVRIQAALPSRPAAAVGDPVRKRCRIAAHTSFRQWGCRMVLGPVMPVSGALVSDTLRASILNFEVLSTRLVAKRQTRIWHNGELDILTRCETDGVFLLVVTGWRGDETTPPKG